MRHFTFFSHTNCLKLSIYFYTQHISIQTLSFHWTHLVYYLDINFTVEKVDSHT